MSSVRVMALSPCSDSDVVMLRDGRYGIVRMYFRSILGRGSPP